MLDFASLLEAKGQAKGHQAEFCLALTKHHPRVTLPNFALAKPAI